MINRLKLQKNAGSKISQVEKKGLPSPDILIKTGRILKYIYSSHKPLFCQNTKSSGIQKYATKILQNLQKSKLAKPEKFTNYGCFTG